MQPRHLQKVFLFYTFDARISGMGSQGQIGLSEPVAQGLGMNPKQTSTGCQRKSCHEENSFRRQHTRLLLCNGVIWRVSIQEAASLFCRLAA
jgi:hypothetical protein